MKRLLTILLCAIVACAGCSQTPRDYPSQLQAEVGAAIDAALENPTGNEVDVRRFIQDAGRDGVAHIPAGCYEIAGSITIPDGVSVVGAGMDRTILYRGHESANMAAPVFQVRGEPGKGGMQISGIAFVGVRDTNDTGQDFGLKLLNCENYRIDHCYFEGFGWAGIEIRGKSLGVVDHCIFVDNFKNGIDNLGYAVGVYGANEWVDEPELGRAESNFVEDCVMIGSRHAIASSAGARCVFRHNTVQRNVVAHSVDAHGMGWGNPHGTRAVEIYDNLIEDPVDNWAGIVIRGGDGVVFNNTIRSFRNPILLVVEWGTPEALKSSYPAFDQIRDLWLWDNTVSGGPSEPVVDDETAEGLIEKGRDYFTEPKPGYVPYEYPHPLATGGPFDEEGA